MKTIALLLALSFPVHAAPIAIASGGGVTVVVTDEPCALEAVKNLPRRATWQENGKTFEGCYGVNDSAIVFYFEDRTVAVFPAGAFRKAVQA